MTRYFLLTLGEYDKENAYLAIIDWKLKRIVDTFNYISTSHPPQLSKSFRGGTYYNGLFYVCTFNEVLAIDIESWKIAKKLSRPTFNDLHDIYVDEQGLWICSTGLEIVENYSHDLQLIERYNMCETDVWQRFKQDIDYRMYEINKRERPREQHINNVVKVDNEILITRGKSESVSTLEGRVYIDDLKGMPHDGFVVDGEFYLTIVKGFIEAFQVGTWERTNLYDLNKCYREKDGLGWCRGLSIDGDSMFIGFTKFRPSKSKSFVNWIKKQPNVLPTRIVKYSMKTRKILDEFVIESADGNTILLYGIYPLDENRHIPKPY